MERLDRIAQARQELLDALEAPELNAVLDGLLAEEQTQRLSAARQRLTDEDFLVAVIGRQGVGKSSMLNALLFSRRVLPVDELETTNVICRLQHADELGERAVVKFEDGRTETGPLDDGFLRQYTDEQLNRHNVKRVREVIGYLNAPLLASGVTLLDTPGVGSFTKSAEQVTMGFLPRISAAIFLMSTTPTLLESEVRFLRATWQYSKHFIFVQNAWADNADEIEDGRQDNLRKLCAIAEEDDVILEVVDVHQALEGACNNRPELIESSGLARLMHTIEERVGGGAGQMLLMTNGEVILEVLRQARQAAELRIVSLRESARETDSEFAHRLDEAEEAFTAITEEWEKAKDDFGAARDEMLDRFEQSFTDRMNEAETRLVGLAHERHMKTEQVCDQIPLEIESAARGPIIQLQHEFGLAVRELADRAEELMGKLQHTTFNAGTNAEFRQSSGFEEGFEFTGAVLEKAGGFALSFMAGAAMFAAGGALLAGEGIAAAVAAAGAAVPGVGWAVAGVALAAGMGLKAWMGREVAAKLERGIRDTFSKARTDTIRQVKEQIKTAARQVRRELDGSFQAMLDQQRGTMKALRRDRALSQADRETLETQLIEDLRTLERAEDRCKAVLANAGAAQGAAV